MNGRLWAGVAAGVMAFAATAPGAGAGQRCMAFRPTALPETANDGRPALETPVTLVTDKATKKNPLVIEYEHELSYAVPLLMPIEEDEEFFNFQVATTKRRVGLHVRAEWTQVPHTDIDLYLHDRSGAQVAYSDAWNMPVVDDVSDEVFYEGHGGMGYEYIQGYRAARCAGYTLLSESGRSPGTDVTLKVWLGPQTDHYDS